MDNTASPSLSVADGQAAKFLQLLENDGVTLDDLQLAIDNPVYRARIVEAFNSGEKHFVAFPDKPDQWTADQLLKQLRRPGKAPEQLFQAKYLKLIFGVDDEERTLGHTAVVLYFGLLDGKRQGEAAIASLLSLPEDEIKLEISRQYLMACSRIMLWHQLPIKEDWFIDAVIALATENPAQI